MNHMMAGNVFGFPITIEFIAFIVSVVLSLVLLIILLFGIAGSSKRERRYIKKASEKNAKIPIKVTVPLPGSGEFISAEMRPIERVTGNVQDSVQIPPSTEIMHQQPVDQAPGVTEIMSQSSVLVDDRAKIFAGVAAASSQSAQTQPKKNAFSAPVGFDDMQVPVNDSAEKVCMKCGNKGVGKFCAKCGCKL